MDFKKYLCEMSVATPKTIVHDIGQSLLQMHKGDTLTIVIKKNDIMDYELVIKGE